jgi:hypothetical protein
MSGYLYVGNLLHETKIGVTKLEYKDFA